MGQAKGAIWSYAACYLLWLVTVALGLLDLAVARTWLHEGYVLLGLSPWGFAAARNFGLVLIAMAWLVGILFAEAYYRDGVAKHKLRRRFATITVAQLVPIVLTLVLVLYRRFAP